jgi:hypothetical protein
MISYFGYLSVILDCIPNFAWCLRVQECSACTWPVWCTSKVRWKNQHSRGLLLIPSLDCRYKISTRPELAFAYLNNEQALSEWPTSMSVQVRFLAFILVARNYSNSLTSTTANKSHSEGCVLKILDHSRIVVHVFISLTCSHSRRPIHYETLCK